MKIVKNNYPHIKQEYLSNYSRSKAKDLKTTIKNYQQREKKDILTLTSGIKKYGDKQKTYRDYLDNITKTPEYLALKKNTLFGRKGPIA